jgi:hypothetical protein
LVGQPSHRSGEGSITAAPWQFIITSPPTSTLQRDKCP